MFRAMTVALLRGDVGVGHVGWQARSAHRGLDAAVEVIEFRHHFGSGSDTVLLAAGDFLDEAGADKPVDGPVRLRGDGVGTRFDLIRAHDRVVVERGDEGGRGGACTRFQVGGPLVGHHFQSRGWTRTARDRPQPAP